MSVQPSAPGGKVTSFRRQRARSQNTECSGRRLCPPSPTLFEHTVKILNPLKQSKSTLLTLFKGDLGTSSVAMPTLT